MARKSKRMALNEAIRQGQAKIAEGLKTGQMRSDNPSSHRGSSEREQTLDGVVPGRAGFLISKEKSAMDRFLSDRAKLILLSCFAVLVLGIGLTAFLRKSPPAAVPDKPVEKSPMNEIAAPGNNVPVREQVRADNKNEVTIPVPMSVPAMSQGDNVICIQSIPFDRKGELAPVAEFFKRKGIDTEIIVDRASGNAVLATKAGFEQNPVKQGTEGYELFQRIKQFGPVYVEETKDTKFGDKPFQDAYGYKR
jgi:hypothetical protein